MMMLLQILLFVLSVIVIAEATIARDSAFLSSYCSLKSCQSKSRRLLPLTTTTTTTTSSQEQCTLSTSRAVIYPTTTVTTSRHGLFASSNDSFNGQGNREDDNEDNPLPLLTQVISDVDDTIKSSGGVNVGGVALGGIDVQYARGELYPGVAQFMLEVSLCCTNSFSPTTATPTIMTTTTTTPPKIAVLTARAEEFKVALELKSSSKLAVAFRQVGIDAGIDDWGIGPVLYGSVAEWIVQYRKGLRKFTNFERLIEQDPTGTVLQYIYVGDTGELDQEAGETMLREYPEVVKAVFLHYVQSEPGDVPANQLPPPKWINGRPIVFFRTYVGAATMAVQLGFMTSDGLDRVIDAAQQSLKGIPKTSDKWIDLDRDIIKAYNRVLFN